MNFPSSKTGFLILALVFLILTLALCGLWAEMAEDVTATPTPIRILPQEVYHVRNS